MSVVPVIIPSTDLLTSSKSLYLSELRSATAAIDKSPDNLFKFIPLVTYEKSKALEIENINIQNSKEQLFIIDPFVES